jgi:glycosyltransferase involved in cell wall biosynthesis
MKSENSKSGQDDHRHMPQAICMIAYANYFTDARIKNYVDILLKNGYRVDVFALGQLEATRPGLRVFCLMTKVWSRSVFPYILSQILFFLVATIRVTFAFSQDRYSIVHVHNMPDFIVFAALIPRIFGAKVILDVHDTMPEFYATKFNISLDRPLIRLIRVEERISASFANHVITTNILHKEALIDHGITDSKISIVMNLANPAIFSILSKEESATGLKLAYHGTIAERLGLDLILKAIWRARPFCPNIKLVLIGDGEFMPKLRKLIVEYGLENVVELTGWVPVEELPQHLFNVDVGVIGNRKYTELYKNWMLPVKMLEYAAMEIPAIAPRLRVICHYFDDFSAFYYTPDDADDMAQRIIELYERPEKIVRAKENLKRFNQKYSWVDMETEYLDIVTGLTSRK